MNHKRTAFIIGLCLLPGTLLGADDALRKGWEFLAGYSAARALPLFDVPRPTPEQQLGLATALLGKYPQTEGNVDQAEIELENILRTKGDTDIKAAALYLLGRIEHIFRENGARAAGYYRQLRASYPDNQLADSAAVKLALIALDTIPGDRAASEVRRIVGALAMPRHRLAQSDFYHVLAQFYLERGDLSAALTRLLKVRELGATSGKNEADLLVQIGRVAGEVGRTDISIEAYQTFRKRFPSDTRNYIVKERLQKNSTGGAP